MAARKAIKQSENGGGFAVETVPIDSLRPAPYNPRRMSPARLEALRKSIQQFGNQVPVVANRRGRRIVGGHQRIAALRSMGVETVPVRWVDLDDRQERVLNLALNNEGEFDRDPLVALLTELRSEAVDLGPVGLTDAEVYKLLGSSKGDSDDDVPPAPKSARTRLGMLITMGPHRLLCGDARNEKDMRSLMGQDVARCLWTDPPYGVQYVGKTTDHLTIANDHPTETEAMLRAAFSAADKALEHGAAIYIAHPAGARAAIFMRVYEEVAWRFRQELVWIKDRMILGHADYHYRHEPLIYGNKPGEGRMGRGGQGWYGGHDQTTVFEIPAPHSSADHPTMKPIALVEAHLRNSTEKDDVVLDPFAGAGSTLIACHRLGRRARLMEIDPRYCDVIVNRWEAATGIKAARE